MNAKRIRIVFDTWWLLQINFAKFERGWKRMGSLFTANRKTITRFSLILVALFLVLIFKPWMPFTEATSSNLALGRTITCNNYTQTYVAANANDGNNTTYWEGAANSYPNTLTVDLGSAQTFNNVVVQLNPSTSWGTSNQTFSVLGSNDGSTYTTIVGSTGYTFNPSTNSNAVSITFSSVSYRYVQLSFTANTGSTGGQVAEFQIFNTATPTPTATPTLSPGETNVALSKSINCNNYTQTYVAANANDGNVSTYWEGANNSYPNTLTVDLGATYSINYVNVKLPTSWGARTQTFSVLGSTDNVNFTTIVASNTYTFDPYANNVVSLYFSNVNYRYVQLKLYRQHPGSRRPGGGV